jgi:hypothetical protein
MIHEVLLVLEGGRHLEVSFQVDSHQETHEQGYRSSKKHFANNLSAIPI